MTLIKNFAPYTFFILLEVIGISGVSATGLTPNDYKPNIKMGIDKQLVDIVPDRFLLNQGVLETEIYVANSSSPYPKISTDIFNGALTTIQALSPAVFFGTLLFMIASLFLILWGLKSGEKKSKPFISLSLISVITIFASLRLSEGWDELFINLRHPYMLLEHGIYSINANTMLEASVDFLPLMLTALLAWTGLGLLNALLIMSLLGNVLLIITTFFLVTRITKNDNWGLVSALCIGIYPNILFIGASGFSATLFCAALFAASYILLYTDQRKTGLLLLSSLTLIRTEGILFACLMLFYIDVIRPSPSILYPNNFARTIRQWLIDGITVLSPFVLSLVVRFYIYGYSIPNPITFKNTNFDYFYLLNGGRQLVQIFFSHDLYIIIIFIGLLWLLIRPNLKEQSIRLHHLEFNALFSLCGVITLFIIPYFTGGGDWFPISWNRYALPFNLILLITLLVLIFEFWTGRNSKLVRTSVIASMIIFFVTCYYLVGQYNPNYFLSHAFSVAAQSKGTQLFFGGNWVRIDRFANLGHFLNKSLPLDATIASGEEATIMYFSKREMVGLLGVSNPEITAMPFQPLSPGNAHHRRRAYASIYHLRPDVIALNDPDQLGDFSDEYSRLEKVHQVMQNDLFQQYYVDKNYYLVGSFDALKKMGYHHLTLVFNDRVFSLFINDRIYQQFIHNIKAQGFSDAGVDRIKYLVDPAITKRFVPAVESLMIKL